MATIIRCKVGLSLIKNLSNPVGICLAATESANGCTNRAAAQATQCKRIDVLVHGIFASQILACAETLDGCLEKFLSALDANACCATNQSTTRTTSAGDIDLARSYAQTQTVNGCFGQTGNNARSKDTSQVAASQFAPFCLSLLFCFTVDSAGALQDA